MSWTKRFQAGTVALVLALGLSACGRETRAETTDIAGVMPSLAFSMTRANDDAGVTAADYRGKLVLLYFGYTHCPDICPTTLANLASALNRLGNGASHVRVVFVTVDPSRDTVPILKSYVESFSPRIDGLRGSANAVAALARRYRVIYRENHVGPGESYSVEHSASVFMFDGSGRARLVTMNTDNPEALAAQIKSLD
jgi:protein SCO1/2